MKYLFMCSGLCLILSGCEHKKSIDQSNNTLPEVLVSEERVNHLFPMESNHQISDVIMEKIIGELKEEKSTGVENVSFTLITEKPLLKEEQDLLAKQVISSLRKAGFLESRIINSGSCFYEGAGNNIRIDALKYKSKELDMGYFDSDHDVGDCDVQKDLPKKGFADAWNLQQMIANKADLVAPREYKGQKTEAAIGALSTELSGGGSSSSSSSSSSK